MTVNLFVPCYLDQLFPQTAIHTLQLLEKLGYTVEYNKDQTCCGWSAYCNGYWKQAWSVGEKFVKDFRNKGMIVTPSTMCVQYVRNHLSSLLDNSSLHNDYKSIHNSLFELSEFLFKHESLPEWGLLEEKEVLFIDSCTGLNECGIYEQPRKVLESVGNLNLISIDQESSCCGFNGNLPSRNPEKASQLSVILFQKIMAVEADIVVFSEPACLQHVFSQNNQEKDSRQFLHLAEFLNTYPVF